MAVAQAYRQMWFWSVLYLLRWYNMGAIFNSKSHLRHPLRKLKTFLGGIST